MIDRQITISLYPPHSDGRSTAESSHALRHETTIRELIDTLVALPDLVGSKHLAPAWSPITYSGDRRLASKAETVCALVYDLDDPGLDFATLGGRIHAKRWVYAIHATYTQGRARLVFPLASDCPARAHAALWRAVASALDLSPDEACADLARLYYAPSRPEGESRDPGEWGGTDLLDPSDFKGLALEGGRSAPYLQPPGSAGAAQAHESGGKSISPAKEIPKIFDSEPLREEIADISDPAKRDELLAFLDGTLRIPPGTRETTFHPMLSRLSYMRHNPDEGVVEELLRRVLSVRDGADTMLEEWVRKALHSWRRGTEKKEVLDQQDAVVEAFFHDEKWKESLKHKLDSKGGVVGLKPLECNVMDVLEHDEAFAGKLRWNLLRQRIEVTGGALAGQPVTSLDVPAARWFQKSAYNCDVSREMVGACIQHVALHNEYDPVREYLEKLPAWDGRPRLSKMLIDYAEAGGDPNWTMIVTRKFFIAAVARALRPGCQVDNTLVLQGDQGGGKTSLVRIMGSGFSVETSLDLHSKDAVMVSATAWLVELGELASLKRSDVESVRNFLTRKEDSIRLPYGRAVQQMPRRCVFLGTTNSRQPLTDPEGSRRFWVVSVGTVDTAGLEKVRDQLWAEALHLFRSGEQWWLTRDESERAKSEASVYEVEDITQGEILAWLQEQKQWPEVLTASAVATKILHMNIAQLSPQIAAGINRSMSQLPGWERVRRRICGKATWCFKLPPRAQFENQNEAA